MQATLQKYLTINSAFSALTGTLMLLFYKHLNAFFGITNEYVFPFIGLNLLAFSVIVGYVARKQLNNRLLVNIISGLDALWVVGSVAIVAFQLFDLTKNGYILIAAIAVWIGFLGYQQYSNNR